MKRLTSGRHYSTGESHHTGQRQRGQPETRNKAEDTLALGEEIVIAPGGPRPRSTVHPVGPGRAVRRSPEGSHEVVERGSPRTREERNAVAEELTLIPGGLRPKSLVYKMEPGASVDCARGRHRMLDSSRRIIADFGAVPRVPGGRPFMPLHIVRPAGRVMPTVSGWIMYGSWSNNTGRPVSSFSTAWVVPPAPVNDSGQTIFLFNGIQNSGNIYQPVLQWGPSGAIDMKR